MQDAAVHETTIDGVVEISKGSAFVGGYMLPHDAGREQFGAQWQMHLAGKRVRVRGITEVHVCGPIEQCLMEGRIPRFRTVAALEVLEPSTGWDGKDSFRRCKGAIAAYPNEPAPPCSALHMCANEGELDPDEQATLRTMIRHTPDCEQP